jgi:hypothetical protein
VILFRRKATATGALLFANALVVLAMDVYMGVAIGSMGLVTWGMWESTQDPGKAALVVLAATVQAAMLFASLLASGFQIAAAVRSLRGDVRIARPAALSAVVVPLLYLPVSLPGVSCVGALFWTVPLVIGLVTLGLALEVAAEAQSDSGVQPLTPGRR